VLEAKAEAEAGRERAGSAGLLLVDDPFADADLPRRFSKVELGPWLLAEEADGGDEEGAGKVNK
jgi:hypothetical protein